MRFISASFTRSSSFYARISGSESGSFISSSFIVTTISDLGGFEADFDTKKVTFVIPSASAGGSADVKALMISASGINPRIGIGVDNPLKAFDFKEISDTNRGGELLIRGSRTTKGAEIGDEAGRINFIIDSSSYAKVETSGSVAEVIAIVDEADASGVRGSLSFRVSALKTEDSIEKIRITPDKTQVTGSFVISGSNSFINIGPAEFTGSVSITETLTASDVNSTNLDISHFGRIDALRVGTGTDPGPGVLSVQDYGLFFGGVHVGGASDPGADNLIVDGTTTLSGTTNINGTTLNIPNLTTGNATTNYDKLLIIDSSGQARTLAKSSVPYIEVFDGITPTNQTLVMFSGSTGDVANAIGINYNSGFGWTFTSAGSVYDVTIGNSAITSLTVVTGSFTGNLSATNITASSDIVSNTFKTISTTLASDSATNVDTFNTSSYTGAIYDYVLIDTTVGARAGQFMIAQDNGSVTFTDNSTRHLFDGTAPEISGQVNGANVEVQVTNGNGYTFKSFVKKL